MSNDDEFTVSHSQDLNRETYLAGDYVFFEGDEDYHFYIVESGQIQILTKTANGEKVIVATIEPGDSFGEFALLDRAPRSASAQAVTDSVLIRVSEEGYQELLEDLPAWASSMLRNFAIRMKKMNDLIKTMPQFIESKKS